LASQFFLTISTFLIYYSGTAIPYLENMKFNVPEMVILPSFIESFAPWFVLAYIFIIVAKTVKLTRNWLQFKVSRKTAWIKPSIELKLFTSIKANEFGIYRKVNLWYSNAINTPLTFGFLKPVILLPVALVNNLTINETESLIIHELTHIKSHDYFLNWMLIVCDTIFFFNPFTRIFTAKIKLEREKNCDSQVLQFNYPSLDYAETLLKTARFKIMPAPFYLSAAISNNQLTKRIRFFTEQKNLRFYKKNYNALAVVPVIAMFVISIFLVLFIKENNNSSTYPDQKLKTVNKAFNEIIHPFPVSMLPLSKNDYNSDEKNNKHSTEKIYPQISRPAKVKSTQNDAVFTDEIRTENAVIPVSYDVQDGSKEIIIKEENSATGIAVTKVYKINRINGKWKPALMWTITESKPESDSMMSFIDSSADFYNLSQ
jgi:beta-lactamase regulating signal transducer with metallopeptidase domain